MSEETSSKPQRLRSPSRALVFAGALPLLQHVAREHGYALAVHGSMATDLDLIAAPWTDDACDAPTLVESLQTAIGGYRRGPELDPNPTLKPHGRLAWSIYTDPECAGAYLDVSVMPRLCQNVTQAWIESIPRKR